MFKKVVSALLVLTILMGCFSVVVGARQVGVGGGAESFCPVEFSQESDIIGTTKVNTNFVVTVTDKNYKVEINSIAVDLPYLEETDKSSLTVNYDANTVVDEEEKFPVSGMIDVSTNSVVRYTVTYDILDKDDNKVWKNLTGYAYGVASGTEEKTGAIGTYLDNPGKLDDGAYFTELDKLNSCYVQVPSASLNYRLKTQHFLITFRSRQSETQVVEGTAPSTLRTYPVSWPTVQWYRQERAGTWLMWTVPDSGYYSFTVDMNANDEKWEDTSNTVIKTEMYFRSEFDQKAARSAADKILALNKTFNDGYYVQKDRYDEETWNAFITALDEAYQVALAVPGPNYGFKTACEKAMYTDEYLMLAFKGLKEAPCIWELYEDDPAKWEFYKDVIVGSSSTCGSGGTNIYTCICGKTKTVTTGLSSCTPSDEWIVTIEPTCIETGEETQYCTECNNPVNTREVEALGHDIKLEEIVAPTCTEQGYSIYSCSRGDARYNDDFVPAKGHNKDKVSIEYPTAIRNGLETYRCSVCDTFMGNKYIEKEKSNFVFTLRSNNNTFYTSVTDSDFNTTFKVPKNSVIDTAGVETAFTITDVESLGVDKDVTLSFSNSFNSESGKLIDLYTYLPLLEKSTLSGAVTTRDTEGNVDSKEYKYSFTSSETEDLYVVNAVPEDKDSAAGAFEEITSHLTSEILKDQEDDIYITVPGTAYIQVGTEKLVFENTEKVHTFKADKTKPTMKIVNADELENGHIEIFIPLGTVFMLGQLKITFNDMTTICLSGYNATREMNTILSEINSSETNDQIVEDLSMFFVDFVTAMNNGNVIMNIDFEPSGYMVSGTVESFDSFSDVPEEYGQVVISLFKDGKRVTYKVLEDGAGKQEFLFEDVPNGEYTVRIIKDFHVLREYEIKVDSDNITGVEYKIHLIGDVDGNGKLNLLDYTAVLRHVKKTKLLEGYEASCADIDGNGKIMIPDYTAILRHVKKTQSLW